MATIFALANFFILPFWLLMIVLPHWRWTRRIMDSLWPIALLALAYAALVIPALLTVFGSILNPTLGGIRALLGSEAGATIGWIHFLAFDLFVGRWAYLDSRERSLPARLVSPTLFFILMLGPLGLLLYLFARWAWHQFQKS